MRAKRTPPRWPGRRRLQAGSASKATTLSLVLNGGGLYGSGRASTERIAERVIHTYGRYICPHLPPVLPRPRRH
jgi:hypothetical protein